MDAPWDRASKTKSRRQEERNAKLEGGGLQINSGRSSWTSKRDNTLGRVYKFLVESRTTDNDSYRIDRKEFLDIKKEAMQTPPGLLPAMQIDINGLSLFIVQLKDFEEFQTRMLDLEEKVEHGRGTQDE